MDDQGQSGRPSPERHVYVSERGERLRRRRSRRRTTSLVVLMALAVSAGVAFATGWAEDAWRHWSPWGGDASTAATAPAASPSVTLPLHVVLPPRAVLVDPPPPIVAAGDGIKIATFLGDERRRLYGLGPAPKKLDLVWSTTIGNGKTSGADGPMEWSGSGWTGQPALVRDGGKLYLLASGYDHNLHKIELATGKVVWEYAMPDVIKSSPSVIRDPDPPRPAERYLVLTGSRRGFPLSIGDPSIAPYRAVAFGDGREVWRLPVPLTACYSRDCDASAFDLDGRVYIGVESGWFYKLDPFRTSSWNGHRTPRVLAKRLLLDQDAAHGNNLVLESSPALLDGIIYVASSSGWVYGMRHGDLKVVWKYRIGSDIDGTVVPTQTGKLLVAVEKQYIPGHGGVLLLDPKKPPSRATMWFFPTGNRRLAEWEGGVVGSVAVNDTYDPWGRRPRLAAFMAIDGYLYVISQNAYASGRVSGPNGEGGLKTPRQIARFWVGGAISTPIMVDDSIVAAGYDGNVHLYRMKFTSAAEKASGALRSPDGSWWKVNVREVDSFSGGGSFESTPIMWKGRVYIGSRNGQFYCVGDR